MYDLPQDVLTLIYNYDDTYKICFKDVINDLEIFNANIRRINILKILAGYNIEYINLYKQRLPVFNYGIYMSENIFYKNLYDVVINSIKRNKRDIMKEYEKSYWSDFYKCTYNHWKRCHKEYIKTHNSAYFYAIQRNNRILSQF